MSESDFGPPPDEASGWPYGPPENVPGYADPGDAMPGDGTRPYGEWHHQSMLPGGWDAPQELEPPRQWPSEGAYVPGQDDQPAWGMPDQAAPHRPASNRRNRRSARRSITIMALLLAVTAAGAGAALLRNGTIRLSPAANPEAGATGGPGAATGAGHGSAGSRSPAAQVPAITKAEARRIVSHYWPVNNQANQSYSDSLLGTIESGSSYSMDTGAYRFERDNPGKTPYAAFKLTDTSYYIPRLSRSAYPRWFVVRGTYVTLSAGKNLGSAYIVFAQDSAGAAWKDVIEPDIIPGNAPPQIATDSGGYTEAVSVTGNAGLSVAPDSIGHVTAARLDKVAADPSDTTVLAEAGNLTDLKDEVFWRSGKGGASLSAADSHSVPSDPVFGLRTTSGGALLFYTTAARLTLTPPGGGTISALSIPGYYSPSSSAGLTSASVGYIEQFATYVPAAGHAGRRVVADIASIASRG